jgi:hypothetical protein
MVRSDAPTARASDLFAGLSDAEILEIMKAEETAESADSCVEKLTGIFAQVEKLGRPGRKLAQKGRQLLLELKPILDDFIAFRKARLPRPETELTLCPTCHGDGTITERQPRLRHIPCPKCGGKGKVIQRRQNATVGTQPLELPNPDPTREDVERATKGLSQEQKNCLRKLLALRADPGHAVSTKEFRREHGKTHSSTAAFSRMLIRLEKRNLIVRSNQLASDPLSHPSALTRATQVALTQLGRAVARTLR